jgi:hypothetical protein
MNYRQVSAPEPQPMEESGPVEMHAHKRYGKFEGHVKMADGSEHHIASQPSMMHAHAELGQLMGPSHDAEPTEEMAGPTSVNQSAGEPAGGPMPGRHLSVHGGRA